MGLQPRRASPDCVREELFKPMFAAGWFSVLQDRDHQSINKLNMKSTITLKNGHGFRTGIFRGGDSNLPAYGTESQTSRKK